MCVCIYVLKTLQLFSVLDLWSYIPLAVTEQYCLAAGHHENEWAPINGLCDENKPLDRINTEEKKTGRHLLIKGSELLLAKTLNHWYKIHYKCNVFSGSLGPWHLDWFDFDMNYHLKHCCRPNELPYGSLYLRQPNEHATLQKLLRKGSKNMWKSPRHSHTLQTLLLLIQPNISRVCWNKLDPCNLQEPKDVIPVFLDQPPEETPRDLTFSPQQSCLGITKGTYKILTRWYKNSGWTVCPGVILPNAKSLFIGSKCNTATYFTAFSCDEQYSGTKYWFFLFLN